jgi:hypothetical protein
MKKIYIICALLVLLSFGCEQNITLNLPKYENKVAVYCILSPGTRAQMYLNLSKSYYDYGDTIGGERFIKTASVVIANTNDNTNDTLKLDSAFQLGTMAYFYTGKHDILPGRHYVASIKYNGKVINAETTVPSIVNIDHYTYKKIIDTSSFGNGSYFSFDIYFNDQQGTENYYVISSGQFPTVDNYNFISDQGQDGRQMDFPYNAQFSPGLDTLSQDVILVNATKATAKYLQELQNQPSAAQDPFAVPVILESNINGGLGIFGAMTPSKLVTLKAH